MHPSLFPSPPSSYYYLVFLNDTPTTVFYTFPYTTLFRSLILVLRTSGGIRTCAARDGGHQRTHRDVFEKANLRLQLCRLLERGDRGAFLPRLGTPHVRQWRVSLLWSGCLILQFRRGDSLRDQGIQLDGHSISRIDFG